MTLCQAVPGGQTEAQDEVTPFQSHVMVENRYRKVLPGWFSRVSVDPVSITL